MSYKFEEDFNVLESFESNEYQTVMMGVANNNPDHVVVINRFIKSDVIDSALVNELKSNMTSMISFEESEKEVVLVTKYHEGMPLKKFLENYDSTIKSRLNFAYEFLSKISIYNLFDHFFMDLLVDEEQIIMKNDELLLNELLVLNSTNNLKSVNFKDICLKIALILDNIVSNADEAPNENIQNFIKSLKNDEHSYSSLNELHEAFKKIYLYDMYLDSDSNNEDSKVAGGVLATSGLVAGVAGSLLNSSDDNNSNSLTSDNETQDDWESDLRNTFGRAPIDYDNDEANYDSEDITEDESANEDVEKFNDSVPLVSPVPTPVINNNNSSLNESESPIEKNPEDINMVESIPESSYDEHDDEILSDEEEEQLQALFSTNTNNDESEVVVKEKNKRGCLWLVLILLLLFLLIFGFNSIKKTFFSSKEKPVVEIVTTQIGDSYFFENKSTFSGDSSLKESEWKITLDGEVVEMSSSDDFTITLDKDGNYVVELRVLDSNNIWSETEKEEFYHVSISNENGQDPNNSFVNIEKLDNYTVEYDNSQVSKDTNIFRNGSYSFRMDFDSNDSKKVFTIKDAIMDDNGTISLWIRSSSNDPVELSFEGYNNQTVIFEKKLKHIPALTNQWRMIQFNVRVPKLVDSVKVTVGTNQGSIWIDDFAINSYK